MYRTCFTGLAVVLGACLPSWAVAQTLPTVTSGNLQLHLDAGVGVTPGATFTWADQSGVGNNFEQTSAGLQPVLTPGVINGRPAVRFTSDRLDAVAGHTLNSAAAAPFSFYAVTVNSTDPFATFDSAPATVNVFRYSAFSGANPNNPGQAVELHNVDPFISFNTDAAGSIIATSAFINPNVNAQNRTLANRTFDAAGLTGSLASSANATQLNFSNPDIGTINGGGNGFFAGDIAEVLYFSGQLSVPDKFAVENYLRDKYGLSPATLGSEQQLPNPTIFDNSTPFNSDFKVENAIDGTISTEYASAGAGTDTFIDFDFGAETFLTRIEFTDRQTGGTPGGAADNITAFDLIFSDDAIFGNADDTVLNVASAGVADTLSIPIDGIFAQFLRFDVTATAGLNPGAAEFAFFTVITPEPSTIAIWSVLGLVGVGFAVVRRRRRARRIV